MLPALFVSHGSPQVLIKGSAARDFLRAQNSRLLDGHMRGLYLR
jgi:aromatic ring-opening dioxygenase catalytic subunit (LigB family)